MTELILARGLPGSGKSTLAKNKYVPMGYSHYEADMFFMKNGVYNFNRFLLGKAHDWCLKKTEEDLKAGKNVVVSNTFTTHKEMKPYLELAHSLNIPVKVIHARGNFKNEHNVPDEVLQRMKDRWQPYPGEEIYIP